MSESITQPTEAVEQEPTTEATDTGDFRAITSQEELDTVISKRLARERKKFADYETLKEQANRLAELEKANLSDTERAVSEALTAKEAELNTAWATRLASTEVKAKAQALGFNDPEDVLTFVQISDFLDNNELDQEALNSALTELSERKPYLLAGQPTAPEPEPVTRRIASTGTPVTTSGNDFESKLKALLATR